MKRQRPDARVVVVERNRPYDTFGWGWCFSDATLDHLRTADAHGGGNRHRLQPLGRHRGIFQGPLGALQRPRLLRHRAQAPAQHSAGALPGAGVELVFETDVTDDQALAVQMGADLVIASDGINSRIRRALRRHLPARHRAPGIAASTWLGTRKTFDAFTFAFSEDRARLVSGARLPVRCADLDLHRGDARARLESARPGRDEPGGGIAFASGCSPATWTAMR